MSDASVVYLMRMDRYHKIGSTVNMKQRLTQLDVGPIPITVIHQIRSAAAGRVEAALHHHYIPKRVRGEWYLLDAGDLACLASCECCDRPEDLPEAVRLSIAPPPFAYEGWSVGQKFAACLARIRLARGLTAQELGNLIGLTHAGIICMESGSATPSLNSLLKLADALRCTVNELCGLRPGEKMQLAE